MVLQIYYCRWYCHFDDDVYVNTEMLMKVLGRYNPDKQKVYIGHNPTAWKNGVTVS